MPVSQYAFSRTPLAWRVGSGRPRPRRRRTNDLLFAQRRALARPHLGNALAFLLAARKYASGWPRAGGVRRKDFKVLLPTRFWSEMSWTDFDEADMGEVI